MEEFADIMIQDCPLCEGGAYLEEEEGNSVYVTCIDCGCKTVNIGYKSKEQRRDAVERAVYLWNVGKVLAMSPGE